MKLINIQDIDKYPENYDFLQEEERCKILNYMNETQERANRYYNRYLENPDNKKALLLYQHTLTNLSGSKNAYATLGIMVENWSLGGAWILATKEDAENYNEQEENNVNNHIEELPALIYYGDIL